MAIPRFLTAPAAASPASFLGRDKELRDIRSLLSGQSSTLALVNAEGGMGKTTLAARYWQLYEQEYQHLAWLFCEKGILRAIRDQLPAALGLIETLNPYADDPDKQIQVIKAAMANLPKDCLLVLDNANEPEHIQGFQQYMNGLGWHVLITSRCSKVLSDAASEYKITGLPPEQAKELFKKNHDENSPDFEALLEHFLHAVGYNTLCIEVFSKNLREGAAWGLSLAGLLKKLEKNHLFLGEDSFEIQTDYTHTVKKEAVKSTDQVIEALYDVADLEKSHPDLHDQLSAFALLPAESHPPTVLAELLRPDDKPGLKRALDQLVQKGWLSTDGKTYRISPVLQKILLQRSNLGRRWTLGKPIVERLQRIFETEGYHPKNIATAGPYAELVFGLVDNLGFAEKALAWVLDKLWFYYNATGNLAKAMGTAEKMRRYAESSEFKYDLAVAFNRLGETHSALGNLTQALTFYEQYNSLTKALHESYPEDVGFKYELAISKERLGSTHSALGNLPQALTYFEQYNDLEKELHESYPKNVEFESGLAISYQFLGITHSKLGDFLQALIFFERYNSLAKALQESNPKNVDFKHLLSVSYFRLGETRSALSNLPQALTYFEQYNALEKSLYESYPENVEFKNGLAISYLHLGQFYLDQKEDLKTAKPYFQKGHDLYAELVRDFPDYALFQKNFEWVQTVLKNLNQ